MSHHIIDAERLLCPLPVIRLQNKVKSLNTDDTVEIICTDPGVLNDIPAWCRINGHTILTTHQDKETIQLCIKVGA